jgi:hypothetical protein
VKQRAYAARRAWVRGADGLAGRASRRVSVLRRRRECASQERQTQFGRRRPKASDERGRDGCPDTHCEARKERCSPRCRHTEAADGACDWKGAGLEKSDHMFGHEGNIEHPPDGEQVF